MRARKQPARAASPGVPFRKVLIANRGEIALRIIWACRELGLPTVAVYSEADRDSLHVRFADEDVCIGPPPSAESYLNIPAVISAAEITDADAIHPGYGFLAENPQFAEICRECKIRFIGPRPDVIRLMGDKASAREAAVKTGIPVLPGSEGLISDPALAAELARSVGFPVIVKASAGGGGRGMRIVRSEEELATQLETARSEAAAVFGSGDVYVEKYLEAPRHIEVQVLGDSHGNIVHLGERECSVQRRYQKLLEESPSPAVDSALRQRMGEAALTLSRAVGYENAGTVEFLLDPSTGEFYFMEMNTRIQVEHPVTELVTGLDLVKEQILVAAGEPLSWKQEEVVWRGSAIECRINAEDPETFVPSPGTIRSLYWPGGPGTRVDTAVYPECQIPPYYDSMVAKLVVHGRDRTEAIQRMRRALDACVIEGVSTTIPLQRKILDDPDFVAGRLDTRFIERFKSRQTSQT